MSRYILKGYTMSLPYSAIEHDVQGHNKTSLITVNISEDDDDFVVEDIGIKPAPADQREAFLARFPSNWSWDTIRRTILIGWRMGLYSTNEALNWLVICGFVKPARRANLDLWMENYALHHIGAEDDTFQPVSQGRGV
jgi:hypothetical protein